MEINNQNIVSNTINVTNDKVMKFLKLSITNNSLNNEVQKYIDSTIDYNLDVLEYWKINQKVFPKLSLLAKKYLIVFSSSTPCERTFSETGRIITKLRSSLTPNHVEQLVILNSNFEKW